MTLLLHELKSSSEDISPGGDYAKRVTTMDLQAGHYIRGMRALGYDVTGVLYDFLRKPAHRPSEAKKETPDAYGRRVLEAIGKDIERYYQRFRVVRLSFDLDESAHDVWQTAAAMREARRSGVFPRNPDACQHWGRACEYLPVCSGEGSLDDPFRYRRATVAHEELDDANRDGRTLLTQSALRVYRACPRKYQLMYEKRVRSLKVAHPLQRGKSVHGAVNVWWATGGDLQAALASLGGADSDPFDLALQKAMLCGYAARWDKPPKALAIEQEFVCDLVNPDTGAKSRTFALAGKVDGLLDEDGQDLHPPDRRLERELEKGVEEASHG